MDGDPDTDLWIAWAAVQLDWKPEEVEAEDFDRLQLLLMVKGIVTAEQNRVDEVE